MKTLLCYTFTSKKLPDFIPYFFDDTFNENSSIFKVVKYVEINKESDFQNDFCNRNKKEHFDEIYIIQKDKIRLHSFYKPVNEFTYSSFEDLGALLCMSSLGNLDVDALIDIHTEKGVEFKV